MYGALPLRTYIPMLAIAEDDVIVIDESLIHSWHPESHFTTKEFDKIYQENKLDKHYLFTILWETGYGKNKVKDFVFFIYGIIKDYEIPSTHWAIIVSGESRCFLRDKEYPGVFYIEFFAHLTHYHTEISYQDHWNKKWDSDSKKALFLTGKPHKRNRIGLLAEFYRRDLLDRLEWSFFMSNSMKDRCREIVGAREFSDSEYEEFLKKCNRNPDDIKPGWQDGSLHYGGFPYDVNLYTKTKLSIISETNWRHDIRITEKTWRTIANNHPFLMAGSPYTLNRLEKLGFHTFKKYFPVSNYNELPISARGLGSMKSNQIRVNALIENTEYFLDHDFDLEEEITENRNRYLDLIKEDRETIFRILDDRFNLIKLP